MKRNRVHSFDLSDDRLDQMKAWGWITLALMVGGVVNLVHGALIAIGQVGP